MGSDYQIRLESALFSILETHYELSRNSFGIVAFSPIPSQPGLRPE
jgi:hypothetical protein